MQAFIGFACFLFLLSACGNIIGNNEHDGVFAPEIVEAQRAIVNPAFFFVRAQLPDMFHNTVAPERAFAQNTLVVAQIVGGDAEAAQ